MGFHDVCVNVGLRQILAVCIIDWHASQVQPHTSLSKFVHDLFLSLMAYCIRSSSFIPIVTRLFWLQHFVELCSQ